MMRAIDIVVFFFLSLSTIITGYARHSHVSFVPDYVVTKLLTTATATEFFFLSQLQTPPRSQGLCVYLVRRGAFTFIKQDCTGGSNTKTENPLCLFHTIPEQLLASYLSHG
jgi:hypothetical protein